MFALSLKSTLYPQRQDHAELTWLNRMFERVRLTLSSRLRFSQARLEMLAVAVMHEGQAWLEKVCPDENDHAQLHAVLSEMQVGLRSRGLSDTTLLIRLLALVSRQARRTLGLLPHPTQLMGAYLLLNGCVAEMDTGEGKSLTAALAAACASLCGCRVHVVTVNDYLAERDTQKFAGFFSALGLRVDFVREGMDNPEKAQRYQADVCYCANKIVVFDYLRDRLALGDELRPLGLAVRNLYGEGRAQCLLPGLQFAIVDEADSVFIDEARTPLVIAQERDDPERTALYRQALDFAGQLRRDEHYGFLAGGRSPQLTNAGSAYLAERAAAAGDLWRGERLREEIVLQALAALHVFHRDIDYIIADGKALIVDENTGRTMPDRNWERGLQQLIEIKEGLPPTPMRENMARLSYQLFFQRYVHLSGMTGTCREVAGELAEVYSLGVVRVRPFRPNRRIRLPSRIYATAAERWQAVADVIVAKQSVGQPVLVGTRSIRASEELARRLDAAGIDYQMLNAKQNAEEATVVARAGQRGRVTIATNMAGRGTDIVLGSGVSSIGGLHVVLTEGHDNTRVDRQLAGRCARQGDPGSWQAILSLEDELLRVLPARFVAVLQRWLGERRFGADRVALAVYRGAQQWVSMQHRRDRHRLLQADYNLRKALSFSGVAE